MIKITLKDLLNSINALKDVRDERVNGRLAYKIGRILMAVEDEYNAFEEAKRNIAENYGTRNEQGNLVEQDGQIDIPEENQVKVMQELQDLMNTEVELPGSLITLEELEKYDFSPAVIVQLYPYIQEE